MIKLARASHSGARISISLVDKDGDVTSEKLEAPSHRREQYVKKISSITIRARLCQRGNIWRAQRPLACPQRDLRLDDAWRMEDGGSRSPPHSALGTSCDSGCLRTGERRQQSLILKKPFTHGHAQ